jgi:hypothetical protein
MRQYVLKILTFLDKWVLEPAGYQDYFMEARRMKRLDPRVYINTIGMNPGRPGHSPYASVTDYFYNIRKRMDSFLDKAASLELLGNIPGHDIRLVDCVIEAQHLAVHYLSYLLRLELGQIADIPPFEYTHSSFYP